ACRPVVRQLHVSELLWRGRQRMTRGWHTRPVYFDVTQREVPAVASGLDQRRTERIRQAIAVHPVSDGAAVVPITGLVDGVFVTAVGFRFAESEATLAALGVGHLHVRAVLQAAQGAPVLDTELPEPGADFRATSARVLADPLHVKRK